MQRAGRSLAWRGWVVAWGLSFGVANAPARDVAWHLEAGKEYRMVVERKVRQRSAASDWLENVRYQVAWSVTAVDDNGQMHVTQKLLDVKHSLQLPDSEPIVYDSTLEGEVRGDATMLARNWKPLLQVDRPFLLMPNGKVERVELAPVPAATPAGGTAPNTTAHPPATSPTLGSTATTPTTTAAAPNAATVPSATTTATTATSTGAASPARSAVAKLLTEGLWTLPTHELQPGEVWEEISLLPWGDDGEALRLTASFQYTGEQTIEQTTADRIDIKFAFEVQPRTDGDERLIVERQSGGGFLDFDAAAGHLTRSEVAHDLTVQLLPRTPTVGSSAAAAPLTNPAALPVRAEVATTLRVRFEPLVVPKEMPLGVDAN